MCIDSFKVSFFELWNDGQGGWSVNDGWVAGRDLSREALLDLCCQRWEVFKENYYPRARVADLETPHEVGGWQGVETLQVEICGSSFCELSWASQEAQHFGEGEE